MKKRVSNFLKSTLLIIVLSIITFIPILIAFSTKWVIGYYGNLSVEEIIFHITQPIGGTEPSIINDYINTTIFPTIFIGLIVVVISFMLYNLFKNYNIKIGFKLFRKTHYFKFRKSYVIIANNLILIIPTYISFKKLDMKEYIVGQLDTSNYIEENYVDPKEVKIEFPEKKKNLIYIMVESYETTFLSKEYGGAFDLNYTKKMVDLTKNNINFSNNSSIGGAFTITGSSWTSSSIVAQLTGLPLKIPPVESITMELDDLLPGAYSIGEILEKENYNQAFLLGSDADFGNRKNFFVNHGNYEILDLINLKKKKMLDEDYNVFWGFEDSKLYSFAKTELKELATKDEPFNLTMLTVNTHAEGGYLEEGCPVLFDDQIENVYNCSTEQLVKFISWVQKQKFYKDTTIVIIGDHISMEPTYFNDVSTDYKRVTYDLFINSAVKPVKTTNRYFTVMDMYPSTLAAMGVKIEGNRLALGTNLFSDEKTLLEEFGGNVEEFDNELKKQSTYYTKRFIKQKIK